MHIAVIGCGVAGLAATRHLNKSGSGFTSVTYERAEDIGGTWLYSDTIGTDEYGLPVHSAMYENLMTNGPKELMTLPGLNYNGSENQSYVPGQVVLKYLNDYADFFGLKKHIKFRHHVKSVNVLKNKKWEINVVDLTTQIEYTEYFDSVMVCTGSFSNPEVPNYPGMKNFEGKKIHSHAYRKNERFKDKRVVVVGCGPSGLDITLQISKVARKVCISHHSPQVSLIQFPENVEQKPDIQFVTKDSVVFVDDTEEEADIILFCTGYTFKYPFLSENVGITVKDNYVQPLYKHMINIEHPSMCIIGIPRHTVLFYMFDLQVRFFLKTLKQPHLLPEKDEMKNDMKLEEIRRTEGGQKRKNFHHMENAAVDYLSSLVEMGQFEPVPSILYDSYADVDEKFNTDYLHYREHNYNIIEAELSSPW